MPFFMQYLSRICIGFFLHFYYYPMQIQYIEDKKY